MEIWINKGKWLLLKPEPNSEWYLVWNEKYLCWCIAGWNRFKLLEKGFVLRY